MSGSTTATRLSDLVVPEVFFPNMLVTTKELSNIWMSGIIAPDATLAASLSAGGLTYNIPFYKDLANDDAYIGSDNPADKPTAKKITTGTDIGIRNIRTQSWSSMDLNAEMTGNDPMAAIRQRIGAYWARQDQLHLVACLKGVFADNAANDAGDMRYVIGTDAVGAITSAELISDEAIIDAKQTMGDAAEMLAVLVMHSVVYSRLQKLDLIDFIQSSQANIRFPTYLGYRVVVDDGCPAIAGTNRILYSTYLVATGAFVHAEKPVMVPVEVDRDPQAGNLTGQEIIYTRRQYILHPRGVKWADGSRAAQFPSNAECALAANWDRVYAERKQIGLVELVTNG